MKKEGSEASSFSFEIIGAAERCIVKYCSSGELRGVDIGVKSFGCVNLISSLMLAMFRFKSAYIDFSSTSSSTKRESLVGTDCSWRVVAEHLIGSGLVISSIRLSSYRINPMPEFLRI